MTSEAEVATIDRPAFRLHDWFEPGKFARLFGQMTQVEDHIKVEEEVVGSDLVIRAEIPGVDPDQDIEITVDDGVLTLSAERRKEERTKRDGGFRSEFSYGSFRRSLRLPKGASAKDVRATYRDGILVVKVPLPSGNGSSAEKVAVQRS